MPAKRVPFILELSIDQKSLQATIAALEVCNRYLKAGNRVSDERLQRLTKCPIKVLIDRSRGNKDVRIVIKPSDVLNDLVIAARAAEEGDGSNYLG